MVGTVALLLALMTEDALSWLSALPAAVRAALLGDPGGDLPPDLIHRMSNLVVNKYWTTGADAGRWVLRPRYVAELWEGRRAFDAWWMGMSPATRAGLVKHRHGLVPNEYREAVGDLRPFGVGVYDSATSTGRFRLHPLVVDYLSLHANM
jgi:hypothetical protein